MAILIYLQLLACTTLTKSPVFWQGKHVYCQWPTGQFDPKIVKLNLTIFCSYVSIFSSLRNSAKYWVSWGQICPSISILLKILFPMKSERIEATATNVCQTFAFSVILVVFRKENTTLLEGLTFLCQEFPCLQITLLLLEPRWKQLWMASDTKLND